MDRQPCNKTFNNNEDQNISWNEKCDKVLSPSELNEFEKSVISLDGAADNPYLHSRDDVGDGTQKPQHYKYRESKQSNSQLTEGNANFAFMNTSNENAAFNLSFSSHLNFPQRGNPLDCLPLDCLASVELCASEAKKEEIVNYSFASGIFEPVYQSQSAVSKTVYTTLITRRYMKTFTSTLHEQNGMQSFKSFNAASNDEYIAMPHVGNQDTLFNNSNCTAQSFEDIYKESFWRASNISVSKDYSGNFGFTHGQKCEESYEERKNHNSSRADSQTCDKRDNEFTNNNEHFLSVNDVHHVAGPSGMSAEAQRHPQVGRFICPLCGKSFSQKDYLVVHYRKHTGEKTYVCDRCGKRFVTNGELTKHRMFHIEEKLFACDSCDKRFARKSDLTKHIRTHTKEKPYKCFICAMAFSQSGIRNRHYKNVHNKK